MVDMYEHVAAYLVMPLSDFLCGSESALLEKLAVRLSVVPLERVDYDIVWGKKRTLALYVSARLATWNENRSASCATAASSSCWN